MANVATAHGWKLDTFENWGAAKRGNQTANVQTTEEQPVRNKPGRKPKVQ